MKCTRIFLLRPALVLDVSTCISRVISRFLIHIVECLGQWSRLFWIHYSCSYSRKYCWYIQKLSLIILFVLLPLTCLFHYYRTWFQGTWGFLHNDISLVFAWSELLFPVPRKCVLSIFRFFVLQYWFFPNITLHLVTCHVLL